MEDKKVILEVKDLKKYFPLGKGKKSPNPENIFIGIAKLIESFKAMDSELITCVDTNIETEMLLEDVEKDL